MPAHVLVEIELPDTGTPDAAAAALALYRQSAAASIARHDGQVRAIGPTAAVVLAPWPAGTVFALIEFPTAEHLQTWHASPDYAQARAAVQAATDHRLLFSHGFSD